ncbi:MAG: GNAT family N-acetyltransferase [bacterium]|nr:GNAT family N-acetyltransferase [bacterium]
MPAPCSTSPGPSSPPHPAAEVEVHETPEGFSRLAPEWRALLEASPYAHPFYDPAWHECWWKHLGSGRLYLCALRRPGGALMAIAPMMVRDDGVLRFTGGLDLTDYLDIIAGSEADCDLAWSALLAHFEGPEGPVWQKIVLHSVPENSPTRKWFASEAGPAAGRSRIVQEEVCPVIALPDSWDGYTGILSSRDERELRRKIRKAHMQAGLEFSHTLNEQQLGQDMEDFIRLHALSQPDKADFWNESRGAFFREMATKMLRLGWLDLSLMRVDGYAVSANFAFDFRDRIYLYNSGFDPEERELSAGVVLLAHNIEEAIQAGRTSFDFLSGDEAYKYQFGAKDDPIYRIEMERSAK